jgi:hypothetical protein
MPRRALTLVATLACLAGGAYIATAPEHPFSVQPFPDAAEYASSAYALAHDQGYSTNVHSGQAQPPRYPPGYPLALAPFAAAGSYPHDVQQGAKFYALAYFAVAVLAAWVLAGPLAGLLAAVLVGASPFAHDAAGFVLSDALVAGLTVLPLALLGAPNRPRARLAGAAAGLALLARLAAAVNLIALIVAWPRRSLRSAVACAVPPVVGLALLQWTLFGSPLRTGYDYWGVADHTFSAAFLTSPSTFRERPQILPDRLDGALLDWVCPCDVGGPQASLPNLTLYPAILAGLFWIFSPPLVPLLGLLYAWRRRHDPVGRYALAVTGLTLLVFWFYVYQAPRFMAGAATVLTVLASVWLADSVSARRGRAP